MTSEFKLQSVADNFNNFAEMEASWLPQNYFWANNSQNPEKFKCCKLLIGKHSRTCYKTDET